MASQDPGAALARAELYRLLACLLSYPENGGGSVVEAARQCTARLPYPLACPDGLAECGDVADLTREFMRLFESGHTACALYGGVYEDDRQSAMQELLRYYRHFGLTVNGADKRDLPDCIATVLEFMRFLCLAEAQAGSSGDSAALRSAQRDLLSRHLGRWAPALRQRLVRLDPAPVYAAVAALFDEFCGAEMRWLSA